MNQSKSFFGGVIYIDLRGYTKIVEEKILENIAEIIYDYQEVITQKIKNLFSSDEIATIEYMGDGVLIVLNRDQKDNNLENNDHHVFALALYQNAKVLSSILDNFLETKKQRYPSLEKIDFGIGLSCSKIYQRNVYNENNLKKREMFFGTCLNRAAKIGDSMSKDYNNIGIDKRMYDKFLIDDLIELEKQKIHKRDSPLVHMYEK